MRRRRSTVGEAAESPVVRFRRIESMAACEFGPGSEIWSASDLAPFLATARAGFAWMEPPPGVDPAVVAAVVAAVSEVAIVKLVPAAAADAAVSEDDAAAPVPVGATVRVVVAEMVAAAPATEEERARLEEVVDAALSRARL